MAHVQTGIVKTTRTMTRTIPKSPAKPSRTQVTAESKAPINPEQRYRMIAEAAYYRAARRNFAAGNELEDWLEAEAEIDGRVGKV